MYKIETGNDLILQSILTWFVHQ